MSYRIYQFNHAPLPERMPEDDLSTGEADSSLLDSVGGAFDYWGANQRLPRKRQIAFRGLYLGELTYIVDEAGNRIVDESGNYIIAGDAQTMLLSQIEALRSQEGKRGTLYRRREADSAVQWCTARLLSVNHVWTMADRAAYVARIDCLFETLDAEWRAETATITSGSAVSGVPLGLTPNNAGSVDVYDAVLTITRTSGTITSVRVQGPDAGVDWTWTGSLGAGETLTVDDGAHIVRKGSADAYSGFARASSHTARGWLPLAVGPNPYIVTVTGGNADVSFSHYNQWT